MAFENNCLLNVFLLKSFVCYESFEPRLVDVPRTSANNQKSPSVSGTILLLYVDIVMWRICYWKNTHRKKYCSVLELYMTGWLTLNAIFNVSCGKMDDNGRDVYCDGEWSSIVSINPKRQWTETDKELFSTVKRSVVDLSVVSVWQPVRQTCSRPQGQTGRVNTEKTEESEIKSALAKEFWRNWRSSQ